MGKDIQFLEVEDWMTNTFANRCSASLVVR